MTPRLPLAVRAALSRLGPRAQLHHALTFGIYGGGALAGLAGLLGLIVGVPRRHALFALTVGLACGVGVLAAALLELALERRLRTQAARLPPVRRRMPAKRLLGRARGDYHVVEAEALRRGDAVLIEAGELIPVDGTVIEGTAAVSEGAVTGESAPVLRSAERNASTVRGGSRVLSDWLVIRVRAREVFFDPLVALGEGMRRESPRAVGLALFLGVATAGLALLAAARAPGTGSVVPAALLIALVAAGVPLVGRGVRALVGYQAMARLLQLHVVASSDRAVEAAGEVDLLLLDKTGTLTLGDRHAVAFHPAAGIAAEELVEAARLASIGDETPEGRSILELASAALPAGKGMTAADRVPQLVHEFSAQTRVSGVDLDGRILRKGAVDAMRRLATAQGGAWPTSLDPTVTRLARSGATPLVVAEGGRVLGVIELRDVLKEGVTGRLLELRRLGIKSVLVTGDNPLTAAAVAMQVGLDDFLGDATPERKLELIRRSQAEGRRVAMCGDGSNDAPALAQADVALVMNSGTSVAKEVGSLVDLDSDPTKILDILATGRQLRRTSRAVNAVAVGTTLVLLTLAVLRAIYRP